MATAKALPRPDLRDLEAGGLRLMLERQLHEYETYGTIETGAVRTMLEITDVGRETVARIAGYIELVACYQNTLDVAITELYATKEELVKVLGCFRVCWDAGLIRELRDDFAQGRGEQALGRVVASIAHAANRKLRKNRGKLNKPVDNLTSTM